MTALDPSNRLAAAWIVLACLAGAGCMREDLAAAADADQPPATSAPPPTPRASLEPDTSTAPIERAAPPTLKPVALGRFEPVDPVATAITGAVEITDAR